MDRSTVMDELGLVARLREDLAAGVDLVGPERCLAAEIAAASGVAGGRSRPRGPRSARGTGAGAAGGGRGDMGPGVTGAADTPAAPAGLPAAGRVPHPPAPPLPTRPRAPPPHAAPPLRPGR